MEPPSPPRAAPRQVIDRRDSGEVAERDGAMLCLKERGAFYATSPLMSVAVQWPKLVGGAQSGEMYHLEVVEGA